MFNVKEQRNRDFINECRNRIKELRADGCHASIDDVVDHVLTRRAPRYYVDDSRLFSMVEKALAGKDCAPRTPLARQSFTDLMRDLREMLRKFPENSVRMNLFRLTTGAYGNPRFYISRQRAISLAKMNFDVYVA